MADVIYGWMKNLAFFFIFMTAILNCLPENQYRKYVQFFLGLILMIVLCRPLLQFFNLDQELSDILSSRTLEQEAENSKNAAFSVEGIQEEYLSRAYESETENQIRILLEEKGMEVISIDIQMGQGEHFYVEQITAEVVNPEEFLYTEEQEESDARLDEKIQLVCEELSKVYEVDAEHINISRG